MDSLAAERLAPDGLIATTDADSEPAPGLAGRPARGRRGAGARAIGGAWSDRGRPRRRRPRRCAAARPRPPAATPPSAPAGRARAPPVLRRLDRRHRRHLPPVGGLEPRAALEDEGFARALRRLASRSSGSPPCAWPPRPRAGRARRAASRATSRWLVAGSRARYAAADFPPERLRRARPRPSRSSSRRARWRRRSARMLDVLAPLRRRRRRRRAARGRRGLADGTARRAAARRGGGRRRPSSCPSFGPVPGQGRRDVARAWRPRPARSWPSSTPTREDFDARLLPGLLGAAASTRPGARARQGRLPAAAAHPAASVLPDGGGRVTELIARPLLNLHAPGARRLRAAAGRRGGRAPRAARAAAVPGRLRRRDRHAHRRAASWSASTRLAQADLGSRQNRHQPLRELSAMSYAVLVAASRRLLGAAAVDALAPGPYVLPGPAEVDVRQVAVEERPPFSRTRRSPGRSCGPGGPRRPSASSAAAARTRRA